MSMKISKLSTIQTIQNEPIIIEKVIDDDNGDGTDVDHNGGGILKQTHFLNNKPISEDGQVILENNLETKEDNRIINNHHCRTSSLVDSENDELSFDYYTHQMFGTINKRKEYSDLIDQMNASEMIKCLNISEYVSLNRENDSITNQQEYSLPAKTLKYLHKKRLEEKGYRMTNKKLGEGGYGAVYKIYKRQYQNQNQQSSSFVGDVKETIRDVVQDRFIGSLPLACKIMLLNKKDKSSSSMLENYSNEVFAMTEGLENENIISIKENFIYSRAIGSLDNIILTYSYIIMEYAKIGTLWAKLKKHGPFNETDSREYFRQISNGLWYLHTKGIAHRDLKLGNILLTTNGTDTQEIVKLADFGLSRLVHSEELGLLRFSKPAGTLAYMSPQIIACYVLTNTGHKLSVHPYDPFKADIWALGVCLYLLLSKLHPFDNPPSNKAEKIMFAKRMLEKQLNQDWQLPNSGNQASDTAINNNNFTIQQAAGAAAAAILQQPTTTTSATNNIVSNRCHSLLVHLFEPNSRKRFNIYEVIEDSWLKTP